MMFLVEHDLQSERAIPPRYFNFSHLAAWEMSEFKLESAFGSLHASNH